MRDLDYIPALNKAGEEKFIEAKRLIKGESEEKKKNYIEQEIDKITFNCKFGRNYCSSGIIASIITVS